MLAEQKAAIHAIPSYGAARAELFGSARRRACGTPAGFEATTRRGWRADGAGWRRPCSTWCDWGKGDGRPPLVHTAAGEPPRVRTLDKIDRAWNMTQRKTAVLTGAFSCCRLGHKVTSADGSVTPIAPTSLSCAGCCTGSSSGS